MLAALVLLSALGAAAPEAAAPSVWTPVPPVEAGRIQARDFAVDELDLPYHLVHFHRLANAVAPAGENRGFIDIPVWRAPAHNAPFNARIMESILSLAWFYTAKRPWNPYQASPALRVRLEAALDFWCRRQHEDGRFSEYGEQEWGLAPTAFATKFMGETLTLLRGGPPIDAALLARVTAAERKAIEAVLTRSELYEHGKEYSNQYTNVYAGGLAYLALHPDPDLEARLHRRIREASPLFQSPAGYFYERKGPDYSYNLGTHQSNLRMALHYARGTDLGALLVEEQRRFFEWLGYNAVAEPDGAGFTLNRAIETRQQVTYLDRRESDLRGAPPADVPAAFPFLPTREEQAEALAARRAELQREWPRVPPLDLERPSSFSPYTFLHRRHPRFLPSAAERETAVRQLAYLRRERFVHQRVDGREGVVFTYVRRPRYYAAFNSGRHLTEQQRYGLGLVWTPRAGALVQSQTGRDDAAWGTHTPHPGLYEGRDLPADIRLGDGTVEARPGARDLDGGADLPLEITYKLGEGRKRVVFADDEIRVRIEHPGPFTEQIPLLAAADAVQGEAPRFVLMHDGQPAMVITVDATRPTTVVRHPDTIGGKKLFVLVALGDGRLEYTLTFP